VIGLVEQAPWYGIRLHSLSEEEIESLITAYSSLGRGTLLEPADLSRFECSGSVQELTTAQALAWEGIRNNNCIEGYAGTVEQEYGDVRVFHLHTPYDNRHSTAVLYYFHECRRFDYELYGPGNSEPTESHRQITAALAGYLVETIWHEQKGRYMA